MNKVNKNVRNAELDGLTDSLVRVFKADGAAQKDAFLAERMAELETLSARITTAILKDKVISTLEEADGARDEAIRALGAVLSGYAAFPIAEKKAAALPLKAVYEKYAKERITQVGYTGESALIESMLEDFSAQDLAESVAALEGVSESLSQIRAAQDAFARANDDYVRAQSDKGGSATSLKKPILSLLNEKIVPYLEAMRVSRNPNCAAFIQIADEEIRRANATVKAREK